MYLIAKYIGKEQVDRYLDKHLSEDVKKRIASKETDIGFYLFVLRLTPIIPYNLINYMSGLLDIELKKYIIISILGIMPGTAVYLNMGDKAINYKSKEFVLSVVFMVVLIILYRSISLVDNPSLSKSSLIIGTRVSLWVLFWFILNSPIIFPSSITLQEDIIPDVSILKIFIVISLLISFPLCYFLKY